MQRIYERGSIALPLRGKKKRKKKNIGRVELSKDMRKYVFTNGRELTCLGPKMYEIDSVYILIILV